MTDLDRRLEIMEAHYTALHNSLAVELQKLIARVDKLEDENEFLDIGLAGQDADD